MFIENSLLLLYSHRGMEQLVARRAHNPKVASSSLAPATKTIKRLYYYSVTVFLMPLAQKIRDKIKTNAFFLWYGLIYLEFKFELHTDPIKKLISPSKTDCKTIISWLFQS